MKQQKQACNAHMLHNTLTFLRAKRKQRRAKGKLLKAIESCTRKLDLEAALLFRQFLANEPAILEAYQNQLRELRREPFKIYFTNSKIS